MPANLYGGLDESKFRSKAKNAVVEYWNGNRTLVKKFGAIKPAKVFVVWQVKCLQNSKALLGCKFEGDGYYFEFTWDGANEKGYLDVYKKQKNIVVE